MIQIIGSQRRERLEDTQYKLLGKNDECVLLENFITKGMELWGLSDDYAGYVIEIDGKGYEFINERRRSHNGKTANRCLDT